MLINIAQLCKILIKGRTIVSTPRELRNSIQAEITLHQFFHAWETISKTKYTNLGCVLFHIEPNLKNKGTSYEIKYD